MQQKLLWKIIAEPDNIWVSLIREKYLKQESICEYKKKGSTSYQWGRLMSLREQFVKGLKWVVGDGRSINFWKDNWLLDFPLLNIASNKDLIDTTKLVQNFIDIDKNWDRNRIQLLNNYLPQNIIDKILQTTIPKNNIQDRMYWRTSTDGWFSTKSSVQMIQKNKGHTKSEVKWIWDLDCPPKVKHFLWILSRNGLPTKEKLQQRRIIVPMQCIFCNHHTENTTHLFLECRVVRDTIQRVNENFVKHTFSINGINSDEKTILNLLKDN